MCRRVDPRGSPGVCVTSCDGNLCEVVGTVANRVTYFKAPSYEALQDDFPTDRALLTDNTEGDTVSHVGEIVVAIIAEV